jgi:putative FmdB family regulatory protein
MPLFEFKCQNCNKKFTKLIGMTADSKPPSCPKCGSPDVNKLISRFTRGKNTEAFIDGIEDEVFSADMDNPKRISQMLKEMGKGLAEDGEENMDELIEETEREIYDGVGEEVTEQD